MERRGLSRETLERWLAAQWWRTSGRPRRDRDALYAGATGLRVLTFHETAAEGDPFRRIVEWCRSRFPIAAPEDADALFVGRWRESSVDRILITVDDGLSSNYEAARWLASIGVRAIFFVVPSLVDRTVGEYLRYHERFGVRAHPPLASSDARGLAPGQVREIAAMGHRVAAHNFAHRDLGRLHAADELRYEIGNALDAISELTGTQCSDFAIGFGQPENVSGEAAAYLLESRVRTYACHRGLNVPGRSPRFLLRHAVEPDHPFAFTRICIEGGADHRLACRAQEMIRRVGALPRTGALPFAGSPSPEAARLLELVSD